MSRYDDLLPFVAQDVSGRNRLRTCGSWVLATDGAMMVARPNDGSFARDEYADAGAGLKYPTEAYSLTWPALEEWIGDATDCIIPAECECDPVTRMVTCEECKGAGRAFIEVCEVCGHEHECKCAECEGAGKYQCEDCNPDHKVPISYPLHEAGEALGDVFNRARVKRLSSILARDKALRVWLGNRTLNISDGETMVCLRAMNMAGVGAARSQLKIGDKQPWKFVRVEETPERAAG